MTTTEAPPMFQHRISRWCKADRDVAEDESVVAVLVEGIREKLTEQAQDAGYVADGFEFRVSDQSVDLFIENRVAILGELNVLLTEEQHLQLLINQLDERVRHLEEMEAECSEDDLEWIEQDLVDERERRRELVNRLQEVNA